MTHVPAGREFFELAVASCAPVYGRYYDGGWNPRHWKLGLESPLVRIGYATLAVAYRWEESDDPIKRAVATDLSIFFTGGAAEQFFEIVQQCMFELGLESPLVVYEESSGSGYYLVAPLPDVAAFLTKKRAENELLAAFSSEVAQQYSGSLCGEESYAHTVREWADRRIAARTHATQKTP